MGESTILRRDPLGSTFVERPQLRPDYLQKLAIGRRYEKYVYAVLKKEGITFEPYFDYHRQITIGENAAGIECKCDLQHVTTGNLFIETEERWSLDEGAGYKPAGIYKGDNAWLYAIGDYATVFLFGVRTLRYLRETFPKKYRIIEIGRESAKGFLLRPNDIERWMLRKIYCEGIQFEDDDIAL